jgi:Lrp/AsnC family transcriptional regulator
MDEFDRKLLQLLQTDATLSIAEISERVGLSATPCWRRIQRLEEAGVITGRVALLSPQKIGIGLTVFVAIEAIDHTPEWLTSFASALDDNPAVVEIYRMAGDVDYMLRVVVADMAEFDQFYTALITTQPMKKVTSRFAIERIKFSTAYPLHGAVFKDRAITDQAKVQ